MTHAEVVATARRVRELAPTHEVAAAVRTYVERHTGRPDLIGAYLEGMRTFLEDSGGLSLPEPSEPAVYVPPKLVADVTCARDSCRGQVLDWCRRRLGLCEESEQESWTGKYVGYYEDRTEVLGEPEIWIFFPRRPQAHIRRAMKEAGWWYMGEDHGRGWQHVCGREVKRVRTGRRRKAA